MERYINIRPCALTSGFTNTKPIKINLVLLTILEYIILYISFAIKIFDYIIDNITIVLLIRIKMRKRELINLKNYKLFFDKFTFFIF